MLPVQDGETPWCRLTRILIYPVVKLTPVALTQSFGKKMKVSIRVSYVSSVV